MAASNEGFSNILVTGGTGLLGTHLILQLAQQGQYVRALYRHSIPEIIKDKATWVQGDLLDIVSIESALQGIEQVYHVAGMVSFNPKDKDLLFKINVEGTANLVNACLDAGIKKMVHVSSVAALGRIRPGEQIDEQMKWSNETSNSFYGKTKYLGELEVWRGICEGLHAVIVNPSIIIGEHGNWNTGSMNIFRNIYKGFPWYSLGGTGFVDADDVSRAMIDLMASEIVGEKFIVSAENISYQQLFNWVADAFNISRPQKKVTPFIAALVWRIEKVKSIFTGKSPLITKESAKTSLTVAAFQNKKLLNALPLFQYTPLLQSVNRICKVLMQKV